MSRLPVFFLPLFFCFLPGIVTAAVSADEEGEDLFPEIEPYKSGHLEVSDLHSIYYECCGNPEGRPVIVLHGGPGVGSYPRLRQYFDPVKYNIVLHDQRGTGRSRPFGEVRGNTTWDLVGDIEKLRTHLKLGKVVIFGGSWGSTLGLAYAETYPGNVAGLILRGIFAGTKAEIDHHYIGARRFFPEEHAALLDALPDRERRPLPPYLFELACSDDEKLRMKVLHALARFELKMCKLDMPDQEVDDILESIPHDAHQRIAKIDLFYSSNQYFLEEGQLLRQAGKIAHIPAILINGRYDVVCPPLAAFKLHRLLPKSKLVIVEEAGHSETEEGVTAALVRAAAFFEDGAGR